MSLHLLLFVERALGLPVSKFMDRLDPNVAKCQLGFIDFLVTPLFEIWRRGLGESEYNLQCLENVAKNRRYWEGQLSNEKKPEDGQQGPKSAVIESSTKHPEIKEASSVPATPEGRRKNSSA